MLSHENMMYLTDECSFDVIEKQLKLNLISRAVLDKNKFIVMGICQLID